MVKNVLRFTDFANSSPVRLALADGQSITHHEFKRDEEGFSETRTTWTRFGDRIERFWGYKARDCDGWHNRCEFAVCLSDDLDGDTTDDGLRLPCWEVVQ
jgi:hypothetical protein